MKKLKHLLILAFIAAIAFQACKTKEKVADEAISDTTNVGITNNQKKTLLQKNDTIKNNASVQVDNTKIKSRDTIVKSNNVKLQTKDTIVYNIVDKMPEFPGGSIELKKYIADNMDYSGITPIVPWGKLYVEFIVTKTGTLDSIHVRRKINPILDKRAIRLVKSFPVWTPGSHKGKAVNVWQTIVIYEPL